MTAQSGNTGGLTWAAATGEANQHAFSKIAVSGQDDVDAESATDTLTFAAGSNVTITTTAGSDTVTISSTNTTYSVEDGGLTQNNFTDTLKTKLDGVTDSANNYSHPNHSGEVTSAADGATVIADNVVDEANLKVSNTPTNGYVLTAQSGNTGGLTWANNYIKSSPLRLEQISAPSTTTGKLYNTSGNLTWNGKQLSSSFTDTPNGLSGTGSLAQTYVTYNGGEIITDIIIDITGLTAGAVDEMDDNQAEPKVLGVSSGSQKYITQITDGINGQIYKAEVISIEDKSTYNFDVFVMFSPVSSLALNDDASNGNNGSVGFLFGVSSSPNQIINNISSQSDTINNYLPFKYSKYDTTNTQWNDVVTSIETTTTSSSSSSKTLQITSSTDIQVGMRISGMEISGIALVDAINNNTLTLSTFQSISNATTVFFDPYNSTLKDKYLYITTTSYGPQDSTMFTSGKCKIKLYGIPV